MIKGNQMSAAIAIDFTAMNAASIAESANLPVGTHLVKGTLKDWQGRRI